jgi:hypothetical protein
MTSTTDFAPMARELAHRISDEVEVTLTWHPVGGELTVSVSDRRTGGYFEVAAAPDNALDVFEHPYAYAAFRGLRYEDAFVPAAA